MVERGHEGRFLSDRERWLLEAIAIDCKHTVTGRDLRLAINAKPGRHCPAGTMYVTLQKLEDQRMVVSRAGDGGVHRTYALTDYGREVFHVARIHADCEPRDMVHSVLVIGAALHLLLAVAGIIGMLIGSTTLLYLVFGVSFIGYAFQGWMAKRVNGGRHE